MGLFGVRRKPEPKENPYAVEKEHEPMQKDTMEIENEKLDKEMEDSLKEDGI